MAASLGVLLAWPTVAVAGGPGVSASSIAMFAPALERRGKLEVDATALGDAEKLVVDRIHEMSKVVFEREAVRAADGEGDPVLKVLIVPLEGDTAGYRITWHVERGGNRIDGSQGVSDCRLCTEGELVDAAVAGIELAVDKMEVRVEPEPPPPEPDPVVDPGDDPDEGAGARPGADKGERKLGGMGYAGIALTVVGAAGLGTGIGLAVRKPKPSSSKPTYVLDTRNPGYGVIAAGAAVAITGVVLLVLDLRRGRSGGGATARRRPRSVVAPWLADDGGGVALQRRF